MSPGCIFASTNGGFFHTTSVSTVASQQRPHVVWCCCPEVAAILLMPDNYLLHIIVTIIAVLSSFAKCRPKPSVYRSLCWLRGYVNHCEVNMKSVLPTLDYCSSVWDPHKAYLIDKLEAVLHFAARFVIHRCHESCAHLLSSLVITWMIFSTKEMYTTEDWTLLSQSWWPFQHPPSFFTPCSLPNLRHAHLRHKRHPFASLTDSRVLYISSMYI